MMDVFRVACSKGGLRRSAITMGAACFFLVTAMTAVDSAALSPESRMPAACKRCHQPRAKEWRGILELVAGSAGVLQARTDESAWVVWFDKKTRWKHLRSPAEIARKIGTEIAIQVSPLPDGRVYARRVAVKPDLTTGVGTTIGPKRLVKAMLAKDAATRPVIVDVRDAEEYARMHLPWSISLPDGDLSAGPPDAFDTNKRIVFYAEDNTSAIPAEAVKAARSAGYDAVAALDGGLMKWLRNGLPVVTYPEVIHRELQSPTPPVIIDVRPAEQANTSHIPRAVSIPADELTSWRNRLPRLKTTPFVLYSRRGLTKDVRKAFRTITRSWHYKNVRIVEGGFSAWQAAGLPVTTGRAGTMVAYFRPRKTGEVDPEEFVRLVEGDSGGVILVDLRDRETCTDGIVPGARNIPLVELPGKIPALRKQTAEGGEILLYSEKGIKAEIGHFFLASYDIPSRYLDAKIHVAFDGSFVIDRN